MASTYDALQSRLERSAPRTWLLTGAAGFIGSHVLEKLLRLGQRVVGLDNFSTGSPANLERVKAAVGAAAWRRFKLHRGSVTDIGACREATKNVQIVLHQAGFVSMPLSLEDPLGCHDTNATGTLNLLIAARDHGAARFVVASSSAVYGDDTARRKREPRLGAPLSPYGASKRIAELHLEVFRRAYGLSTVALRYFNVFGPGQNPAGSYAAVIPLWIRLMLTGEPCLIYGDGSDTRDFCPVSDIVQANLLAACAPAKDLRSGIYNIGRGEPTSLRKLHDSLAALVREMKPGAVVPPPRFAQPRPGDIAHSAADVSLAKAELGFTPAPDLETALRDCVRYYAGNASAKR
jgi:UDP-N-acetylglucosamine 4-epimerase